MQSFYMSFQFVDFYHHRFFFTGSSGGKFAYFVGNLEEDFSENTILYNLKWISVH